MDRSYSTLGTMHLLLKALLIIVYINPEIYQIASFGTPISNVRKVLSAVYLVLGFLIPTAKGSYTLSLLCTYPQLECVARK